MSKSTVKKLTMKDFEKQRLQQDEAFKTANLATNYELPSELHPDHRQMITKKTSEVQATMPLATELPVTNNDSRSEINPN